MLEVRELCNLVSDGGVAAENVVQRCVALNGDQYVCVRESGAENQVTLVVVDLTTKGVSRRKLASLTAAVMHPTRNVVALASGQTLQVFDLGEKKKVCAHLLSEPASFLAWTSGGRALAAVTDTGVLLWDLESGGEEPRRLFDRDERLGGGQVLSLCLSPTGEYAVLVVLVRGDTNARKGMVQLWSKQGASKVVEGHAACFASLPQTTGPPCTLLCVASAEGGGEAGKLTVLELPTEAKRTPSYERRKLPLEFQSAADFPVGLAASPRHSALIVITLMGEGRVVGLESGRELHRGSIAQGAHIFAASSVGEGGSAVCAARDGRVFRAGVSDTDFVASIQRSCGPEAAMAAAEKGDLGGAEALYQARFDELLAASDIPAALQIAVSAPRSVLRTDPTLHRLQQLPQVPGQRSPLRTYFQMVLEQHGTLNEAEGVEFARILLAKEGGADFVRGQIEQRKMLCSAALGDLLEPADADLALKVYGRASAHEKVTQLLLRRQQYSRVVEYAKRTAGQHSVQWKALLASLIASNPDGAAQLALLLHSSGLEGEGALDPLEVTGLFVDRSCLKHATQYLLEVLKRLPQGAEARATLETRLLEINLTHSTPQVADGLLLSGMLGAYDAARIAGLCERAGLYNRALEAHATAAVRSREPRVADMQRVVEHLGASAQPEWLAGVLRRLPPSDSIAVA
eukprot:Hpha_TRINITY_DN15946_c3_g9::TRINITY_DN15946_c3_g9_i1::g.73175::m.73175/K04646/CLTC; clathrin heavy chain